VHRDALYQHKTRATPKHGGRNLALRGLGGLLSLIYFSLLPALITIVLNWVVYYFAESTIYHEFWMMPLLLTLGTFIGGVFIRQQIESGSGGLTGFSLGILGLLIFAGLTYGDMHQPGGLYSRYMPQFLRPGLVVWVFALPGVGFLGMLFYKFFSLKN
jgi:hypothetical protein